MAGTECLLRIRECKNKICGGMLKMNGMRYSSPKIQLHCVTY